MEDQWSHIRWIGGSPCAGKSTIATHLANQFELNLYHCDDYWDEHTTLDYLSDDSLLKQLGRMSTDEIFMRPVDVQLETEIEVYQEEFQPILNDLAKFPTDKLLLIEGAALQPDLVVPLITHSKQAIWIVPTEDFQRRIYPTRDWMHDVAAQTSNPPQVIENWMSRDVQYASWVTERVTALHQTIIVVDGKQSIEDNIERVRKHFQL